MSRRMIYCSEKANLRFRLTKGVRLVLWRGGLFVFMGFVVVLLSPQADIFREDD